MDLPSQAEEANRDPQSFLRKNPAPVIIDEVQYAPDLFRHLKTVIDQNREARGQFILTGSQKFTLMKSVADSLAGRVGLMELEGLSAGELGSSLQHYLQKHGPAKTMARGFYPQLWRELDFPSFEYYQSYIATYLERDVRQILNVTSLRDFERFMLACAIRSGQILNKSELAKDVGIHHKTANDWLSALQASNQIFLLEPFSTMKPNESSNRLWFQQWLGATVLRSRGGQGERLRFRVSEYRRYSLLCRGIAWNIIPLLFDK